MIRVLKAYEDNRLVVITSLLALLCLAVGSLVYFLFGNRIIESIYRGESVEFLNRMVANHRIQRPDIRTLEHYQHLGRLIFSRVFLIAVGLLLCVVGLLKRRALYETLKSFFTAVSSPVNLAVFRIVLFYTIFEQVDPASVAWFSQLPQEFRIAPAGSSWLIHYLPINPAYATICAGLLIVVSLSAMIGLFSRTSAFLTAGLAIYVLGIPQFYGKVNHYHHLVWFAAILAASRCGDALSVDALISAWRRAKWELPDVPAPATLYALPLRFVWVLLGITYFFAGFWKLWSTGFDWFLTENMKLIMYQKWAELGGWTPFFRVDQYPSLYKLSALAAVGFELSFVFLIFSRRLRLLAGLGGLAFHTSTFLFMRIWFGPLVRCYVSLFQWDVIFGRVGRLLFREPLYLVYDGNCTLCRRTMASLRVFDILGRITYVNALDREALERHELDHFDSDALLGDIHAVTTGSKWLGFEAYRATAARLPILWPIVPLLYMWPVPALARRIYRRTADTRSCSVAVKQTIEVASGGIRTRPRVGALVVVGCFLLVSNSLAGMTGLCYAWPFAAYPNFGGYALPEIESPEIAARTREGKLVYVNKESLWPDLSQERYFGLVNQFFLVQSDQMRAARLQGLFALWSQHEIGVRSADSIILSRLTLVTIPERRAENPLRREVLYIAKISDLHQLARTPSRVAAMHQMVPR